MIGIEEMRWIGPYPPQMGQTVHDDPKVVSLNVPACVPQFGYWVDDEPEYPQDELELMIQFQEALDKE